MINPFKNMEAASGFEPLNNGFADHCLSHLATPPNKANVSFGNLLNESESFNKGNIKNGHESRSIGSEKQRTALGF